MSRHVGQHFIVEAVGGIYTSTAIVDQVYLSSKMFLKVLKRAEHQLRADQRQGIHHISTRQSYTKKSDSVMKKCNNQVLVADFAIID